MVTTVLNPAPAKALPNQLLSLSDYYAKQKPNRIVWDKALNNL